jgi:hypothetical protein
MNQDAKERRREAERRMLPFFVEFVKFSAVFVAIIAAALFALHSAAAAMP